MNGVRGNEGRSPRIPGSPRLEGVLRQLTSEGVVLPPVAAVALFLSEGPKVPHVLSHISSVLKTLGYDVDHCSTSDIVNHNVATNCLELG